jgi:DUF1680 family protein
MLPMPVRLIESHPYVEAASGRVALVRGPILYCAEQIDQAGLDLRDVRLVAGRGLEPQVEPGAGPLAGLARVSIEATVAPLDPGWDGRLYRTWRQTEQLGEQRVRLTLIPYYAWANRDPGRMMVWLRAGDG